MPDRHTHTLTHMPLTTIEFSLLDLDFFRFYSQGKPIADPFNVALEHVVGN